MELLMGMIGGDKFSSFSELGVKKALPPKRRASKVLDQ
jgi:hypothetical protein